MGSHRAELRLRATGGYGAFAWAHVEWRLPGIAVDARMLRLHAAAGGDGSGEEEEREELPLHVTSIDSESVTLLFEPPARPVPRLHLYYLPFVRTACETGPSRACSTPYKLSSADDKCAADFGARVGDSVCCGQTGTLGDASAKCPARAPTCTGYVAGAAWGQCIADARAVQTGWARRAAALAAAPGWRDSIPRAAVTGFQARTERDSFYPMEVAATAAEVASLRASGRPLMVWPEDRIRPIRMTHTLPLLWVAAGAAPANGSAYRGEALRGEFFTFQIGAYAPQTSLALHVRWTELRGRRTGGVIGAARLRCINQPSSSAAARDGLHVAVGAVLPLWIGVDVPSDAPADSYRGAVLVSAAWAESGASDESVAVELAVGEDRAVEAGDGEPWRHSRLRWLDSTAGAEEEEAPEQPQPAEECDAGEDGCVQLQRREDAVVLIAPGQRQIALSAHGLPASLKVGSAELLASPVELRLRDGKHDLKLLPLEPRLVAERGPGGSVSWRLLARAHSASATALHVRLSGSFANDGLAEMAAELHVSRRLSPSGSSVNLSDVRLELPLLEAMVPLINGFDVKGGSRPAEVRWRWDKAQSTQDHAQRGLNCRVWLGSAAAGLQLNLQGGGEAAAAVASSCGNDEDGRLQCGDVSDAQFNAALGSREWYNSNRGGATVLPDTTGDHPPAVRLSVHTGELPPLRPGERLRLHWRLLLTPVRGAGGPVRADFATRYFHMQRHIDLGEALDTSPTRPWIILHQGNPLIPYINYPFIELQPLRRYVRDAHAAGAKVKLYYTVRELSSRAVELWALRALGSEVLISSRGKAAGHAWLREHLRANYTAAWHEVLTDGEVDAAVQTPAFTSRWDNYWIEGILWLVRNIGIDGIYLDGAPYERTVLRRLRRALAAERRGRRGDPFLLDLHASCAGNPHLPYMELYPYLDSIWFGEQCEYRTFSPPMWLAEVSGVPFGLGSELLGDNSDQWQGLVHGMTCRIYPDPWKCNPRPLWAALDAMGMLRPRLLGWWDPACPVSLLAPTVEYGHGGGRGPAAVASVFIGDGAAGSPPRFAVAVANWADHPVEVRIRANYSALAALGLRSERKLRLRAREIDGFQSEAHWALGDAIRLEEKGGGVDQGLLLSIL